MPRGPCGHYECIQCIYPTLYRQNPHTQKIKISLLKEIPTCLGGERLGTSQNAVLFSKQSAFSEIGFHRHSSQTLLRSSVVLLYTRRSWSAETCVARSPAGGRHFLETHGSQRRWRRLEARGPESHGRPGGAGRDFRERLRPPAAGARPAATLWATSGYGFRVWFQLLPPLGERGEQRQALGPEFVIDRDQDLRLYVFAG